MTIGVPVLRRTGLFVSKRHPDQFGTLIRDILPLVRNFAAEMQCVPSFELVVCIPYRKLDISRYDVNKFFAGVTQLFAPAVMVAKAAAARNC